MRRALAGLGMWGLIAVGVPQCSIGGEGLDLSVHHPNLFVNILKPPFLPIMHASAEVSVIHTPRTFELQAFLWEWISRSKGYDLVRSWKRFKADLPDPGDPPVFFRFPDLKKLDKNDDLLTCEDGPYFMNFHIFGTSSTGDPQDYQPYFPYDTRRGHAKYEDVPSAKQSWQVKCDKTGQVPNPPGTSAPVLVVTLGADGWNITPR